jgi:nucleoid DNA-binding protein
VAPFLTPLKFILKEANSCFSKVVGMVHQHVLLMVQSTIESITSALVVGEETHLVDVGNL